MANFNAHLARKTALPLRPDLLGELVVVDEATSLFIPYISSKTNSGCLPCQQKGSVVFTKTLFTEAVLKPTKWVKSFLNVCGTYFKFVDQILASIEQQIFEGYKKATRPSTH